MKDALHNDSHYVVVQVGIHFSSATDVVNTRGGRCSYVILLILFIRCEICVIIQ